MEKNNKYKLKQSLLPIFELRNVDILYPEQKIHDLMNLSEDELNKIWNKKNGKFSPNEIYNFLIKIYYEFKNSDKNEHTNLLNKIKNEEILKEVLPTSIEVFKDKKNDDFNTRVYGFRTLEANWAISKFILEHKNDIWHRSGIFRKKIMDDLKINDEIFKNKSFGYLPSVSALNDYLDFNNSEKIDDLKPYIYFNWRWAYRKYINNAIKNNEKYFVIKIDIKKAFDNMEFKKEYDDPVHMTLSIINGFSEGRIGIKYGFLIESYILSQYYLTNFKYEFISRINEEGINIRGITSYVDDSFIFLDDDQSQECLDFLNQKKESFGGLYLNTEKTTTYKSGSGDQIIQDSTASTIGEVGEIFDEDFYNDKQELGKIKQIITIRNYDKLLMSSYSKKINLKNIDDFKEYYYEILSNKYSKLYFKEIFENKSAQEVNSGLQIINKVIYEKNDQKYVQIILKFIDILSNLYLEDCNVMNVIEKFIQNLLYDIKENNIYDELNITKLYNHLYKKNYSTISSKKSVKIFTEGDIGENLNRLFIISEKIYEINKISDAFHPNIFDKIKFNDTKPNQNIIIKKINEWLSDAVDVENRDEEIDDDSYKKEFTTKIKSIIRFKENNTLLEYRLNNAILISKSRLDVAKNIMRLTKHIITYEYDELLPKPSLWSYIDNSDIKIINIIKKLILYSNDSNKRNQTSWFAKLDFLIIARNYLKMLWSNGSRELEHYSNHGIIHCDDLIKNFKKFYEGFILFKRNYGVVDPRYKINTFVIILSILTHDIGLLDDEIFFSKFTDLENFKLDNQNVKESYFDLRRAMTNNARKYHGETSGIISKNIVKKIKVSKYDLSNDDFSKAAKASILHNASPSHYVDISSILDINYFIISYLDLTDTNWKRIGRPYLNIGTHSADYESIYYWIKDLIVDDTFLNWKHTNFYLNIRILINKKMLNYIIKIFEKRKFEWEKYSFDKYGLKKDEFIRKTILSTFFETELKYMNNKIRLKNDLYSIDEKIFGINAKTIINIEESNIERAYKYKTLIINGKDDVWIEKVFSEESNFVIKRIKAFLELEKEIIEEYFSLIKLL